MSQPSPSPLISGRFEVLRTAGSGGMGIVYQATDHLLGRTVALKILRASEPGLATRFAHEVEVLSALDHPHIVGYVGHGLTENGLPYLVMPWLDGQDLETRLAARPLPIDETLALARAVAEALAYLHGRGLVHRDLKPSNLFLPDGDVARAQLIDLGITRAGGPARTVTESGVLVGTPNFISPEQARGDGEITPSADIFALGCVLFECLTGKRLFTGSHPMSILAKILLEDAPPVSELRPDVPPFLDVLVSRMVAKDPGKRPADGAELLTWLSSSDRAEIPALQTLTANELRVVTVLVVTLSSAEGELLQASSKLFGVQAHVLAGRTAIVLTPERFGASDQASLLTRFARHVVEGDPLASAALTTGSATTDARLPVGQAIDRAVAMVRAVDARGVNVDDATAALITARFDVQGGRVVGERASLDATRRLMGKPTSCVGRERELALLEATFTECVDGNGPKAVLVTADAGAGKSRLQHEFVRRLSDAQVLVGRGDPFHASIPYAMVAQVVRQAIGVREIEPAEQIREKLRAHVASYVAPADAGRVCDFLGELVGAPFDEQGNLPLRAARQDVGAMADQIGRAFEDLARAWCARRAVVVVLEDLHWGHGTCVKLLDRALWKLAGSKLFVLALARPEVHGRFPALFAKRDVTEVHLPPLPARASATLVHEVLGADLPAADVERIIARSEGNAFYLEELIRAAAAPALQGELPEAVLAVAQARLERLEPDERRVLRAASVFGDVFCVEGVSALVGWSHATVGGILASLVQHEAIVPSEHPRLAGMSELAFRHALLRGTAYATLTEEDRKLGHRLAAIWLRDILEDNELVARHWLEGGERAEAVDAFRAAAELRVHRAQPDAAARSVARALLVLDADRADVILRCVELLADALAATRRLDAQDVVAGIEAQLPPGTVNAQDNGLTLVRSLLQRALGFLRRGEHPQLAATFAAAASALGALGDFAAARSFLEEARSLGVEDAETLRIIRFASARISTWSVNAGAILALLAENALPEEPEARRQSLLMLAQALVMVGGRAELKRGLDLVDQAEAIGPSGSDREWVGGLREDPVARFLCAKSRGVCFGFAGEHAKAAEAAEQSVDMARRAGLRYEECAQLHNAAEAYCLSGDRERSRARLLESSVIARDLGRAELIERHNDMLLAFLDRDAAHLALVAEAMRAVGNPALDLFAHYWLGHLLAELRAPGARPPLERALGLARKLGLRNVGDECEAALTALPPAA